MAGVPASSSPDISLTHRKIHPLIEDFSGRPALLVSLLFGVRYAGSG
ncbi:hypothetical protein [Streptomyces sp. NPDC058335]